MFKKKSPPVIDDNRKAYRDFFGIGSNEQYLIYYTMDSVSNDGYIVFIDGENDLDFVDKRDRSKWTDAEIQSFQRCLGKLQQAEATPCHNLPKNQLITFKRILGSAYLQILEKDFSEVEVIIKDALQYLSQRNVEVARELFLSSAGIVAIIAAIIGLSSYFTGGRNIWTYSVLFGILGAFFSIWMRYGRLEMTGLASKTLHYLEAISRLFIGAIAAVIVLFAIRSGLLFSNSILGNSFFFYCVIGFAAGFSERFVPSLIELIIKRESK